MIMVVIGCTASGMILGILLACCVLGIGMSKRMDDAYTLGIQDGMRRNGHELPEVPV